MNNYQSNNNNLKDPYSGRNPLDKSPVNIKQKPMIGLNNSPKQISSNRPQSGNHNNINRPGSERSKRQGVIPSTRPPSSQQQQQNLNVNPMQMQNRNKVIIEKVDYKINRNNPYAQPQASRPASGVSKNNQIGIVRSNNPGGVPPSRNPNIGALGGRIPSNQIIQKSSNQRK